MYRRLFRELVAHCVVQVRSLDPSERRAIQPHSHASFAHSAAGLAYSLWKVHDKDDRELLELGDRWIDAAAGRAEAHGVSGAELEGWDAERARAITAPYLGPMETATPLGFLQGYAGLACLSKDLASPRHSPTAGLPIFEA